KRCNPLVEEYTPKAFPAVRLPIARVAKRSPPNNSALLTPPSSPTALPCVLGEVSRRMPPSPREAPVSPYAAIDVIARLEPRGHSPHSTLLNRHGKIKKPTRPCLGRESYLPFAIERTCCQRRSRYDPGPDHHDGNQQAQ